jgi:beta-amylase
MAVMAPLYVAEHEWDTFVRDLRALKAKGFDTLSVDVWWGLVQKEGPQSFDWSYYDRLYEVIRAEGMRWMPLLSTHACGGNVGDSHHIPVPEWVWSIEGVSKFRSELGHENIDAVSCFSKDSAWELYKIFWLAFSERYLASLEDRRGVQEVGLSLGPSGELHYPSYHAHDASHFLAHYPERGLFQGMGPAASDSFARFIKRKYGPTVCGESYALEKIIQNLSEKLDRAEHLKAGALQDVFSWYHQSLLLHFDKIVTMALDVFSGDITLAVKIPGIHWNATRQAELMNGLIDPADAHVSWNNENLGLGYAPLFALLRDRLDDYPQKQVKLYLTAAATLDAVEPFSRAESLVRAFAQLAFQSKIQLALENALAGDLYCERSLAVLCDHLSSGRASGFTLLRLEDVLRSEALSQDQCQNLLAYSLDKNSF